MGAGGDFLLSAMVGDARLKSGVAGWIEASQFSEVLCLP